MDIDLRGWYTPDPLKPTKERGSGRPVGRPKGRRDSYKRRRTSKREQAKITEEISVEFKQAFAQRLAALLSAGTDAVLDARRQEFMPFYLEATSYRGFIHKKLRTPLLNLMTANGTSQTRTWQNRCLKVIAKLAEDKQKPS